MINSYRAARVLRVWLRHNRLALRSGSTLVSWREADGYVALLDELAKA